MSASPGAARSRGVEPADDVLFEHQARAGGKVVAILRGIAGDGGAVTVEAEVYNTTSKKAQGLARPFPFPNRVQAERFADETLRCLQYLGCDVVDPAEAA